MERIPEYPSRRLVGIELELDALGAALHLPNIPPGWCAISDASLRNGREFIIDPPLPMAETKPLVEAFCAATKAAGTYAGSTGGYHIHVQAHDYTHEDAASLAKLYTWFQPCIDELVAKSRRSPRRHQYCTPYDIEDLRGSVTEITPFITRLYHLDNMAVSRRDAKMGRHKMTVNLAMLRVRAPLERSIEFRQPSPSTNLAVVYGWLCLAVALVDLARNHQFVNRICRNRPTMQRFLSVLRHCERTLGAVNLVEWAIWRRAYLSEIPDGLDFTRLLQYMTRKPAGVFTIAKLLGVNNAVAFKIVEREVAAGRFVPAGRHGYRCTYGMKVANDLEVMRAQLMGSSPAPALTQLVA